MTGSPSDVALTTLKIMLIELTQDRLLMVKLVYIDDQGYQSKRFPKESPSNVN